MEISYYKLASGSFSLANYRRKDGQPDVERDWEAIEDAAACIAQAMKKDPHYGPVVLVSMTAQRSVELQSKASVNSRLIKQRYAYSALLSAPLDSTTHSLWARTRLS